MKFTFVLLIAAGLYILFTSVIKFQLDNYTFNSESLNKYQLAQLIKLKNQNRFKPFLNKIISEKIAKLKKIEESENSADEPNEFVKILNAMKIPYGETKSGYPENYKLVELEKARRQNSLEKRMGTLPWIERGPGNVSGRVRGLIVDPDDTGGNTWFVGSVGGGIWKTTNAGQNWRNLSPNIPNLAVSALAMAQSNHNIIYAGTGESMYNIDVINGDGLLKSTDRGETWNQITNTVGNLNFNNVSRIIVDPSNADIVLASTSSGRYRESFYNKSGIFKSTNGGTNWYQVYDETSLGAFGRVNKVLQIIETPGNFNILFGAVDQKGIIKSTDAGETWKFFNTGIDDSTGRFEIAISPVNTNKIFAAAEGNPYSNLYVSTNAGSSWQKSVGDSTEPNWLSSQGWYDNTIVAHPYDENIVYVGGVRLYRIELLPSNKRKSIALLTGNVHVDNHNLIVIKGQGTSFRLLDANDGGIGVSSDNSMNWTQPINGLNTTEFYGVDKMPGGSAYVGGMQDNGTWRSPENSTASSPWNFQIGGDGYETSWNFDDPLKIIGGSQYNGLERSTDGGLTFNTAITGLDDVGSGSAPFITKIGKTNLEPNLLFAVGKQGVWKSTDFGENWNLTSISSINWGGISSFHDVKVSKSNPNIVWAGSRMDVSGKINVSVDKGETFTPTNLYSVTSMGGISGLATHPIQDSTAYALFSFARKPKILRTTNLGQTWEDISGFGNGTVSTNGFPDVAVYDLLVMPQSPDTIWAGTEIGLFESTDNGKNWHAANNGLPSVAIWSMTNVEDEIVIGSHGRGIWSVKIPALGNSGTYKPLIKTLSQDLNGFLNIQVRLRSLYDSSIVKINGARYAALGENKTANEDTLIQYAITQAGNISVYISSYKNGVEFPSVTKNISAVIYKQAQNNYLNNFNSVSNDFIGSGFAIKDYPGFVNPAIHTTHPYGNQQVLTYTLTVPIIVAASSAIFSYDDIALMEPGDPGSVFGDPNFWDYVITEATTDGTFWIPLSDGYDSRYKASWTNDYNLAISPDSTLFSTHQINLLDHFNPGDKILIRFRLFADEFVNGWGWVIDNVNIQNFVLSAENKNSIPHNFILYQNYPNPFNPTTKIKYTIPFTFPLLKGENEAGGFVTLKVFDILGKEVETIVNGNKKPGNYEATFNGSQLSSGVYFYRIEVHSNVNEAANFTDTKKLILLK